MEMEWNKILQEKISEILGIPNCVFTINEDLSVLGMNSIKSVQLIVELEEMFNIAFEENELFFENFYSLNKISELLSNKLMAL